MQELLPMKRCVQTDIVLLIMELLTGEQVRAIEAAKGLIAADSARVDPEILSKIVLDRGYKPWSKVMAAYVLGFLPMVADSRHQLVLREVLADTSRSVRLRDHAAEALGNLHDESAVPLLSHLLDDERESKLVRKSCISALSQLSSAPARATLERFASTSPQGSLAQELASAGIA